MRIDAWVSACKLARLGKPCRWTHSFPGMQVPQQDNSCDCGVYVLEYIERFSKDFTHADSISVRDWSDEQSKDWFKKSDIKAKRAHIMNLLDKLHDGYRKYLGIGGSDNATCAEASQAPRDQDSQVDHGTDKTNTSGIQLEDEKSESTADAHEDGSGPRPWPGPAETHSESSHEEAVGDGNMRCTADTRAAKGLANGVRDDGGSDGSEGGGEKVEPAVGNTVRRMRGHAGNGRGEDLDEDDMRTDDNKGAPETCGQASQQQKRAAAAQSPDLSSLEERRKVTHTQEAPQKKRKREAPADGSEDDGADDADMSGDAAGCGAQRKMARSGRCNVHARDERNQGYIEGKQEQLAAQICMKRCSDVDVNEQAGQEQDGEGEHEDDVVEYREDDQDNIEPIS
jgi:hypothetical protein